MGFEWDPDKARSNFRKHSGVRFEEAKEVFDDPFAVTIKDDESDTDEQRFVSLGMGALGRVLVVAYTYRGENVRIVSARLAEPRERSQYEKEAR